MKFFGALAIALTVASPLIGCAVEWLLGEDYSGVWIPVTILTLSTAASAFPQGLIAFLYAENRAGAVFRVQAVLIPAFLFALAPLGVAWGVAGLAAASTVLQLGRLVLLERVRRSVERPHGLN